jgi:DNA-binding transcriptional LysR family regulator
MDRPAQALDWSLIRSVLAVAETGSLSAAARLLGLTQPTLGRQIRAAEAALGAALFRRVARGLVPTEAGAAILPAARAMRAAAAGLALAVAGQDGRAAGTVRLTASVFAAHHLLPPVIAELRTAHPDIQIELVPSDAAENLLFREADIALRMFRPTQLDIVARRIGRAPMGLYAARDYLARRGVPETTAAALGLDWVGYDRSDLILRSAAALGFELARESFGVRCDNQATYWELVRAGCGIGGAMLAVGERDPAVQRILPGLEIAALEVWLAMPAALRAVPRVRLVWAHLAACLGPMFAP